MSRLHVACVQFENRNGDKHFNLHRIRDLTAAAVNEGAEVVAFHECSISGYTFARRLSKTELLNMAEPVPSGPSTDHLITLAAEYRVTILAGLFERDDAGRVFNTYLCVNDRGVVARHRKIHPFINPYLTAGDEFTVFQLGDWQCGILTCYDNNIIENVRATALLGAQIIFMPHVTMCTPSTRPGAGFVNPELWYNRMQDPTSLRLEFDGLKGRAWLMKWLPARAFDNGIFVVFANPIGMDDDQLKNGCAMIIDPYGDVIAECRKLDDDFVVASLHSDALSRAGGNRYKAARKPELYGEIISRTHASDQKVSWISDPGGSQ